MKNKYFVSIVGKSNVGKSTLINHLCDQYVTSESSKPETTRLNIIAETMLDDLNLIIIDTPGLSIKDSDLLSTAMKNSYLKSLEELDLLIILSDITKSKNFEKNSTFLSFKSECSKMGTTEEALASAEKIGFNTGLFVLHPLDKKIKLPIYIANFVLMDYGTGAIFGCPAHDQRDLDFANKYNLVVIEDSADTIGYKITPIKFIRFTKRD